jgi:2-polyprenyl-6-methoxyphenol hydroxylase-like FAD-dependent oxidoreductase
VTAERHTDVIIIGGGIGGLAAGIALRQAGLTVAVFERTPVWEAVGAGLSLWPNAMYALQKLGLGTPMAALGTPQADAVIRTWRGEPLSCLPASEMARRFGSPLIGIHRADLQHILLDALGADAIHLGAECVGIEEHTTGVRVTFADGSCAEGAALIGADGLRSAVRAHLWGSAPPRYAGYTAWRGVTLGGAQTIAGEWWGRGVRFGAVPLSEGRVYWFASVTTPEGGADRPDERKLTLLRLFAGWDVPVLTLIAATGDAAILRNDIYDRAPLPRWGRGRVTLLGDAAHPMTPNLGQGAGQALEDAVVLGACLGASSDPASALRAYEERRRARTAAVVRQSRLFGQLAQSERHPVCWLRDALFRWTPTRLQFRQLRRFAGYRV